MENPIKAARMRVGKTLLEYSDLIGIHVLALYYSEQGTYPHIIPSIEHYLRRQLSEEDRPALIQVEYSEFQRAKRQAAGKLYELADMELDAPSCDPPVVAFRRAIGIAKGHPTGLSRSGFAKTFCIHLAELYSLENGEKHHLSEQFKLAMRQAGLPDTVLEELDFRCGEFARGEWVSRDQTGV